MCNIEQLMATCKAACLAGGDQLLAWRGKFSAREKAARDFVTDADIASQEAICSVIKSEFPDHGILGEESPDPSELNKEFCWIVDPLDGTTNYVHGFPFFAVSIAVAHQRSLVAGGVYDPLRKELFLAGKGKGAFLNDKPLRTSKVTALEEALVAVSFPPHTAPEQPDIQGFLKIAPICQAVRRTGSAAINLAYVAGGMLEVHYAYEIHSWDSAAGVILIQEAGGVATAVDGSPYDVASGNYLVAATAELHQATLDKLKS